MSEDNERKEWSPSFYFGQDKMPAISDIDVKKMAYRERREREKATYRIAQETLYKLYERNGLAKEGYVDVQKAEKANVLDVDQLVKRILKGKF